MSQYLACSACNARYDTEEPVWRCSCGGLLDLVSSPRFHKADINATIQGLWRYAHVLPVLNAANVVSLGEGMTPLVRWTRPQGVRWAAPAAANGQGMVGTAHPTARRDVWLKLDYITPTGSFKDRGATVLVSKVKELGVSRIVEDSSGNAGAAIAAYAALAGIRCQICVPASASGPKLSQIQVAGATVAKVRGARENAAQAALNAAESSYYASHAWNPFFIEGVKTIAFEICEQLGWRPPDALVVPVGNGTLLLGLHKGFSELRAAGVIRHVPKLVGVQSEACAPLCRAFQSGSHQIPEPAKGKPKSVADGILVAKPVRGSQILDAVRASGGYFVTVSDGDVAEALRELCQAGLHAEPTAAVGWAGLKQCAGLGRRGELVVVPLTGSGLKSPTQVQKLAQATPKASAAPGGSSSTSSEAR